MPGTNTSSDHVIHDGTLDERLLLIALDPGATEVEPHMQHTVRIPAQVERLHVVQAADEEHGSDQKYDRQRRLTHEQPGAQPTALAAPLPLPGLERGSDVGAQRVRRR